MSKVEADFGDGPVTVYFRRINLYELELIEAVEPRGRAAVALEALCLRARDEGGERMFSSEADQSVVRRQYGVPEIVRVVKYMNDKDAEQIGEAGNS